MTTDAGDTAIGTGTAEFAAVASHSASATAARTPTPSGPALLEPLPGDLYGYEQMLPEEDQRVLLRLRGWLQREVASVANARSSASSRPLRDPARRAGHPHDS